MTDDRTRYAVAAVGACLVLFAAAVANWDHAVLRFSSPAFNAAFLLAALALPWLALVLALVCFPRWVRLAAVVLLVVPLGYSVLNAPLVALHLGDIVSWGGRDLSFELVAA